MGVDKTILVTGATGAQGGGVIDAVLGATWYSPNIKLKALTRDASSDKAKALFSKGNEVVQGDLSNKESLLQAFQGADYLFLVTDFYGGAKGDPGIEITQGKNAVDAAKETGVKFVVFSTLDGMPEDVKRALPEVGGSGLVVPHFESKAVIEEYLEQSGVPFVCLLTAGFYQNYMNMTRYMKQPDGTFVWRDNSGCKQHVRHAVEDIGLSAAEIFSDPEQYKGKTVPVIGEVMSNAHVAETISSITGEAVRYEEISDDEARQQPFPAARDLANMYAYQKHWPYCADRRKLNDRVHAGPTFAEWAERNKGGLLTRLRSSS